MGGSGFDKFTGIYLRNLKCSFRSKGGQEILIYTH